MSWICPEILSCPEILDYVLNFVVVLCRYYLNTTDLSTLNMVRILSHENAISERGFSVNNAMLGKEKLSLAEKKLL